MLRDPPKHIAPIVVDPRGGSQYLAPRGNEMQGHTPAVIEKIHTAFHKTYSIGRG